MTWGLVCCDENYWGGYLSREALQAECPLLARSGLLNAINRCLLSGVKRTLLQLTSMSAFDPKRTFAPKICCDAQRTHRRGRVRPWPKENP
jgi:hypothetical protein